MVLLRYGLDFAPKLLIDIDDDNATKGMDGFEFEFEQ